VTVEPVTPRSPRPVARGAITAHMRDVCFISWAVPPESVESVLPEGSRPDLFQARAYVSLVALRLVLRPLGLPRLPYVGSFPQMNVRTYTVDDAGRRGVAFLSIDADRLVPSLVARAAGLPYRWSRLHVHRRGGVVAYVCARRRGDVTCRLVIRLGAPVVAPTALTEFLTARWGMHLTIGGRLRYVVADHEPWPLYEASVVDLRDGLVPAGLAVSGPAGPVPTRPDAAGPTAGKGPGRLGTPVSVVWSPGVDTRFGW
jgi:uncharacterized protein